MLLMTRILNIYMEHIFICLKTQMVIAFLWRLFEISTDKSNKVNLVDISRAEFTIPWKLG